MERRWKMKTETKIKQLLNLSRKNSGASLQEAHSAALIALKLAKTLNKGHLIAKCNVAVFKANKRLGKGN